MGHRLQGVIALAVALGVSSCGLDRSLPKSEDPPLPPPPLDPVEGEIAQLNLTYLTPEAVRQSSELVVNYPGGLPAEKVSLFFDQPGVRKTVLLANLINGLEAATDAYFADLIAGCEELASELEVECTEQQGFYPEYTDLTCAEFIEQQKEYARLRCLGNNELELSYDQQAGVAAMTALIEDFEAELAFITDDPFTEELALLQGIRENMAQGGAPPPYRDEGMASGAMPAAQFDAANTAGAGGGTLGVTPGGAQDIGYIRTVVADGYVPLPTHFAVEGLFSEHDLPLQAAECSQIFCVNAGLGFAQNWNDRRDKVFIQVGFSSGLTEATFRRRPLNLVIVLDVSGSMGDSAVDSSKIAVVKKSLQLMVDKLTGEDQLTIVTFNNESQVFLSPSTVQDKESLKRRIAQIEAGGGTNIEAGLQQGFQLAKGHRAASRMDRVMLLTDALPNVGRTGENAFLDLVKEYGEQNIGLTSFGVGVNFGQELILELSRVRGGNYFFLEDNERIQEVFERDFDLIVTPVAYDFQMTFRPSDSFQIDDVYGIETWEAGDQKVELTVPTLFLSRNKGAILLELERIGSR